VEGEEDEMKTCPVCKARCFDDMEICYGCMHRFEEEAADLPQPIEGAGERRDSIADADGGCMMHDAMAPTASEPAHQRHSVTRKDPSRVFGAVDEDESSGGGRSFAHVRHGQGDLQAYGGRGADEASIVMLRTGPLVSASLGNGYRLVVSVEAD
jgi:hypothetical protein